MESIEDSEILMREYKSIISEIDKQADGSLCSVFIIETNPTVMNYKYITGGAILWLIAILCLFMKSMRNWGYRILGFFVFIGIGCAFGMISKAIPTIVSPMVNYIGFPLVVFIFFALLATSTKKTKQNNQGDCERKKQ